MKMINYRTSSSRSYCQAKPQVCQARIGSYGMYYAGENVPQQHLAKLTVDGLENGQSIEVSLSPEELQVLIDHCTNALDGLVKLYGYDRKAQPIGGK